MIKKSKKLISLISALLVTVSIITAPLAQASETNNKILQVEKVSSITLDGKLDESQWNNRESVSKLIVGDKTNITANYKTLWDDNNLYIGIEVKGDNTVTTYDDDSFTFYMSPLNYRGTPYSSKDFQVQVFDKGTKIVQGCVGMGNNDNIDYSSIKVESNYQNDGYTMEVAVPWSTVQSSPAQISKMGFDIMVFHEEDEESVLVWNGTTSNWQDTRNFGTLEFKGEGVSDNYKAPSLTTETKEVSVGSPITVKYTGTSKNDWIGIYHTGAIPNGNPASIGWAYTKNISQPDGSVTFTAADFKGKDLEPGVYDAILMENDGYNILSRVTFTIKEKTTVPTVIPSEAKYNRTATRKGYADGTIVITQPEDTSSFDYYSLYYGNDEGKLEEYTRIVSIPKTNEKTVNYNFLKSTFIPEEATKILVYTGKGKLESEDYLSIDIDSNYKFNKENPLYNFQVMSDIHVTSYDSVHNKHLSLALQDIKNNCKDSAGIFAVGDTVDHGSQIEYDALHSIIDANKEGLPSITFILGNHELFPNSNDPSTANYNVDQRRELFKKNTNSDIYFDKWINGQHFIALGSEATTVKNFADLSDTQLKWLEDKLAESKDSSEPIYLFLHQSIPNTVAGSIGDQGWHGVEQSEKLREIIAKYPQVIYFSGHSHWELESESVMYDGESKMPSMFDTASVGYLWTDSQQYKEGSQGYYVEVYKDKLLVKGRDFVNSKWIPEAQFVVDLNEKFPASSITLEKDNINVTEGEEAIINATVNPANALTKDLVFTSSDETIAKVDENGVITAIKDGNCEINVTLKNNENISATCKVNVEKKAEVKEEDQDNKNDDINDNNYGQVLGESEINSGNSGKNNNSNKTKTGDINYLSLCGIGIAAIASIAIIAIERKNKTL
ncbi:MAG: hypothetical protein GX275_14045 [Clostridiales bacterium]|nr:hypothetical protein [Clostridiales bacterium]